MGYTTDFSGTVTIDPPLNEDEISFLEDFNRTRRMHRSGGPLFVKSDGPCGQGSGPDTVLDGNRPDPDQPGLWCQWVPDEYADPPGSELGWDGGEKFYNAAEWMEYIVNKLLSPAARAYVDAHLNEDERLKSFTCDHKVDGVIEAEGEEPGDLWKIVVEADAATGPDGQRNAASVTTVDGQVTYSDQPGESVHEFHGWIFEITSVAVDVKGPLGYVLTKVPLEDAVQYVILNGTPDGQAVQW
jgi:hypothetical protein